MIKTYILGYVLSLFVGFYDIYTDKEEQRRRYFIKDKASYWIENMSVLLIFSFLSWFLVSIYVYSFLEKKKW